MLSDFRVFFERSRKDFFFFWGVGVGQSKTWFFNIELKGFSEQLQAANFQPQPFPSMTSWRPRTSPSETEELGPGSRSFTSQLSTLSKDRFSFSGPQFLQLQNGPNDVSFIYSTWFFHESNFKKALQKQGPFISTFPRSVLKIKYSSLKRKHSENSEARIKCEVSH